MKILFTGASSLTGMWFVKALVEAGHEVTVPLRGSLESYAGLRQQRIAQVEPLAKIRASCPFGSEAFLKVIQEGNWDCLCHHAADVTNYKSSDFDPAAALANNTHQLKKVLLALKEKGCQKLLLTGSVFEQDEGKGGSEALRAVSPYGLSKGITSAVFRYYASVTGFRLGKFVIPNPFGPFEEPRFTTYLIQSWFSNKTPAVNTPDYIRDNIPVSLMAQAYSRFAEQLNNEYQQYNPSFYVEDQGTFTERFAREMRARLPLHCNFELKQQVDFPEPRIRINYEKIDPLPFNWSETKAWDELAAYYQRTYG